MNFLNNNVKKLGPTSLHLEKVFCYLHYYDFVYEIIDLRCANKNNLNYSKDMGNVKKWHYYLNRHGYSYICQQFQQQFVFVWQLEFLLKFLSEFVDANFENPEDLI